MKTNVNMIRKMGDFEITQRSKDGMFNATILLKQWDKLNPTKKKHSVKDFLRNDKVKAFISVLDTDLNGAKMPYLTTRGKTGGTWMHPYLFLKFAMWINPEFELQIIKFVYDQLIDFRNDAGDNYRGLTNAVQNFTNINYPKLAKGLNWIVFKKHQTGIRQEATQNQLKQLNELQRKLAFAVDMGYIKSFDELINEMRRIYNLKKAIS